jgi:hypothetical protein
MQLLAERSPGFGFIGNAFGIGIDFHAIWLACLAFSRRILRTEPDISLGQTGWGRLLVYVSAWQKLAAPGDLLSTL